MSNRVRFKNKYLNKDLLGRVFKMILILFICMLGKYLPIATIPINNIMKLGDTGKVLENLMLVSGGQLSKLTLFSLGLSPWMSSMILWRFVTLFKFSEDFTSSTSNRYRLLLMFIIALLQAYGFSALTEYFIVVPFGEYSKLIMRMATILILISGAFVIMWLGNLNTKYGLGGPSVIIVSNMILTFLTNIQSVIAKSDLVGMKLLSFLGTGFLLVSIVIFLTVLVYRAEYRIPMRRVSIISRYAEKTYLPIRLTPAGGMPFMYGMTLMVLPPLFIGALSRQFPNSDILEYLASHMSVSHLPGILVYIGMLFILSIGFAFFNTDPVELAENMQKNGDYFENVRPGEPTRRFITDHLFKLALLGSLYTVLMGGVPVLLAWMFGGDISLSLLLTNIFIVISLMLDVIEQVVILQSWKSYKELV